MIKSLFVGRRASGISRATCHAHLLAVHGPMVVCAPPGSGPLPIDYVQNHVFDGVYPSAGPYSIDRDLATQLWSDSLESMKATASTPYYLANMKPDEPRFVDDVTVAKMRMDARTIIEGPRGEYRLFVLANRAAGLGDDIWAAACATGGAALGAMPGVTALVENIVAPPPAGERFVEVVLELWLDTREAASALVERADPLFAGFGAAIDRDRSFALAARTYPRDAIRAMHLGRSG